MMKPLTDYQKKILKRLNDGELLYRFKIGPWTPAFKFQGGRKGVNGASIYKLFKEELVKYADKITMNGLTEYVYIPGTEPWMKDESYRQYQKSEYRRH